ncbi:MAG: enoyl-CoA hydratase/isomerase family protein [Streptosporangiaceae bacterium]
MAEQLLGSGPVLLDLADDGVARLRLNRPEAANAMNLDLLEALYRALLRCDTNPRVRAILITGEGRNFCAGGDVRAFAAQGPNLPNFIREVTVWLNNSISMLTQLTAPVVVAVHGVAAGGGGFGLVCAADLVIAGESARFFGPGTRIGMTPDAGTTVTLPALVGFRKAMEIILTNPTLTAADALNIGLLNRVVTDDALLDEALSLARQLAAGPREANAAAKRLLWEGIGSSVDARLAAESSTVARLASTPDVAEGLASFAERREPRFAGSAPAPDATG